MGKMRALYDRYSSIISMAIYMVFYMTVFGWLERRTGVRFHVIHTKIDHAIPFCEYFVVPYFLWFMFVAICVIYIGWNNQDEARRLNQFLMIGMTLFLVVSIIYPNVQFLRPRTFTRDNIFIDMVKSLYRTDTSTNILPSIHVYNSIAVMIAFGRDERVRKHKTIKWGIWMLGFSIILSTMFIKQHSIIDVFSAGVLGLISYGLCYKFELQPRKSTETSVRYKY